MLGVAAPGARYRQEEVGRPGWHAASGEIVCGAFGEDPPGDGGLIDVVTGVVEKSEADSAALVVKVCFDFFLGGVCRDASSGADSWNEQTRGCGYKVGTSQVFPCGHQAITLFFQSGGDVVG